MAIIIAAQPDTCPTFENFSNIDSFHSLYLTHHSPFYLFIQILSRRHIQLCVLSSNAFVIAILRRRTRFALCVHVHHVLLMQNVKFHGD